MGGFGAAATVGLKLLLYLKTGFGTVTCWTLDVVAVIGVLLMAVPGVVVTFLIVGGIGFLFFNRKLQPDRQYRSAGKRNPELDLIDGSGDEFRIRVRSRSTSRGGGLVKALSKSIWEASLTSSKSIVFFLA